MLWNGLKVHFHRHILLKALNTLRSYVHLTPTNKKGFFSFSCFCLTNGKNKCETFKKDPLSAGCCGTNEMTVHLNHTEVCYVQSPARRANKERMSGQIKEGERSRLRRPLAEKFPPLLS